MGARLGGALHPLRGPHPRHRYRHAAARKTSAVAALAAPHLSLRPRAAPARRLAAAAALPRREPPLMGRSRGSPRARLAPLPTPAEKTPSLLSITASLLSNLSLSWQMIVCNAKWRPRRWFPRTASIARFAWHMATAGGSPVRFPIPRSGSQSFSGSRLFLFDFHLKLEGSIEEETR